VTVDANTVVLYGILATFATGVVKQFFDSAAASKHFDQQQLLEMQRHQWDREDRAQIAQKLEAQTKVTTTRADAITAAVAENTDLTRQGIAGAEKAYSEANAINEKLAREGVRLIDDKKQ
jgi:cysteinyl-tRNA synthetase